jgi:D-arabinose 1-dehydrogenase-like Zn-dependent alcohol dehydrogenase
MMASTTSWKSPVVPISGNRSAPLPFMGRISVIGVFEGFEVAGPAGPLLLKSPSFRGSASVIAGRFEDFVQFIDSTGSNRSSTPAIPWKTCRQALDHLDRGAFGKIVIDLN